MRKYSSHSFPAFFTLCTFFTLFKSEFLHQLPVTFGLEQDRGTVFTAGSVQRANAVFTVVAVNTVDDSEALNIVVREEIFKNYLSLVSAVGIAFIIERDLDKVIKMTGYLQRIAFLKSAQDLLHGKVKRTEREKSCENKNQS